MSFPLALSDLIQINCGSRKMPLCRLLILRNGSLLLSKHAIAADDRTLFGGRIVWSMKQCGKGMQRYFEEILRPVLDPSLLQSLVRKFAEGTFQEEGIECSIDEENFTKLPLAVLHIAFSSGFPFSIPKIRLIHAANTQEDTTAFSRCAMTMWGLKDDPHGTKALYRDLTKRMQ